MLKTNRYKNKTKKELIKEIEKLSLQIAQLEEIEIKKKKVEEEVINSEQRYRTLFEKSPDSIIIVDPSGVVTDCNKATEKLIGYSKEDIIGKPFIKLLTLDPKDIPILQENIGMLSGGRKIEPYELEILINDGEIRYIEITYSLLYKHKTIDGFQIISRDITERKQAEKILQESERKYRALVENQLIGIVIHFKTGEIVFANPAAYKIMEIGSEDGIVGRNVLDFVHPDYIESVTSRFKKVFETNKAQPTAEEKLLLPNGSTVVAEITGMPIMYMGESAIMVMIADITKRKQAEEQIRVVNEKLQYLLSVTSAVIYTAKTSGDYGTTFISKNITQIVGYEPREFIEDSSFWIKHIYPDDLQRVSRDLLQVFEKQSYAYEYRFRCKNGTYIWFRDDMKLVRDQKGNPLEIVGFIVDITEEKIAKQTLEESEAKFRDLTNMLPLTVFEVDLSGKLNFFNQHGLNLFGLSQRDIQNGFDTYQLLIPEDRKKAEMDLKTKFSREKIRGIEYNALKKDGTTFPISVLSNPIFRDNQPVGLRGVILDMTERSELERKLENIAEDWNITFDTIKDPIALLDQNVNVMRCNRSQIDFLGKTFSEVIGSNLNELIHSNQDTPENCSFQKMLKTRNRESCEFEINGSWYMCTVDPILGDSGEILRAVHIMIDITERKRAEEVIKKQNVFLKNILESLTHPFYIVDAIDYRILIANPSAKQFVSSDHLKCYQLTHNRETVCDGKNHPCPIEEIKKTKKPMRVEHIHFDKKGNARNFEIYAYPIFDSNGEVNQIIEYSIDITERRKAEESAREQKEQLIQADKMVSLGILASGMAHEINNPNNSIKLNAKFLEKAWNSILLIIDGYYEKNRSLKVGGIRYEKFRNKVPQLFSGITDSSKRIQLIVEDLKRFFRKEPSGKLVALDINSVVKTSVSLIKNILEKSTRNLTVINGKSIPKVLGNFQQLEQVVVNLLENACHALTSVDQMIEVSTSFDKKRHSVVIKIKDEGMGISKEDLKYITDPFYTTKRSKGGTGLGLSISTRILNEHNGYMEFESSAGKGTTVRVFLKPIPKKQTKQIL